MLYSDVIVLLIIITYLNMYKNKSLDTSKISALCYIVSRTLYAESPLFKLPYSNRCSETVLKIHDSKATVIVSLHKLRITLKLIKIHSVLIVSSCVFLIQ